MKKPKAPSDLWESLDKIRQEVAQERPEGTFTVREYSERYGIPQATAKCHIAKMIGKGIELVSVGRARKPAYYRIGVYSK